MKTVSKKINSNVVPTKTDLFFVPLGGTNEVGMNLSMLGHDKQWLILDCGITFNDRLGIDVITADPTFAVDNAKNIKGMLITHAHEDHIGAIEYLWPILRCPIYATKFTATVVKNKIKQKSWFSDVEIITVEFDKNMSVGNFDVEFLQMTHSIPEPSGIVIKTPLGTVVHTGDWKMDPTPVIGKKVNEKKFAQIGENGVLAYFSDSTNIFTEKDQSSEKIVRDNIIDLVLKHKDKRITIACFASNIARLETADLAARKSGRKIVVIGRSLEKMISAAQESGYLTKIQSLIDDKTAMSMPPEKVMMICTGSQGEHLAALMKIASNKHQVVKMNEKDIVLFSSRVIPGNEKSIGELHSLLAKRGVDIITSSEEEIHSSGHPSKSTIAKMYSLLKPKIVVPVHGEARHIIAQSHFAKKSGIEKVITPSNGCIIQLAGKNPEVVGEINFGKWAVDGKRMVNFDGRIIKDRKKISEEGVVFVTVQVEKQEITDILVTSLGIEEPGVPSETLCKNIKISIKDEFDGIFQNNDSNKKSIAKKVSSLINNRIGKSPIVDVHIIEV